MLYLILIYAVWRLYKHIKRHCTRYPYLIEDYQQPQIDDCKPDTTTDSKPDYFSKAEIARLETQKLEYMALLDAIEREQADLQEEYKQASVKRRSAISSKLTSLASRHAATNRTLSGIDSKIEKLYNQ